jgi:MFS transporter, FSR family, fosmidomycin resistance protein
MKNNKLSLKDISVNLAVYGLMHFLIDCICAGVIFSLMRRNIVGLGEMFEFIILYNLLAFGSQCGLGIIVDKLKYLRMTVILGCIATVISAFIYLVFPLGAIIFAGVGNALFHLGGGSISLNLTPKKASAPGVFVAPGALGLLTGTLLGKNGQFNILPIILLLFILCCLIFIIRTPEINYQKEETGQKKISYSKIIILLIFLSIAVRSLVGFVTVFPWKSDISLLITLTTAIVLGKGLGGIVADKFGWLKVAIAALILSMPLLGLGSDMPFLGIMGMLLFNIPMSVTLTAISNTLPGRPAFTFGLTCLALFIGALPVFTGTKALFTQFPMIPLIIFISVEALFVGLMLLHNNGVFDYDRSTKHKY